MRNTTIIGLGLIGGSIGKALRRAGWEVAFVDPAVAEHVAVEAGAADAKRLSLDEVDDESVIILCMPVDVSLRMLDTVPLLPNLITSVCSVMAPLQFAGSARKLNFIAGHPMAGSEQRGLPHASAEMFSGRQWFLESSREDDRLMELIRACDAHPVAVASDEHDRIMALTSHLPQLLSTALASLIASSSIDEQFFGSGLRTFLRLAGSDRSVWHSVIEANGEHIDAALGALERIVQEISDGDDDEHFEKARELYGKLT